jgi:hypothetical protein
MVSPATVDRCMCGAVQGLWWDPSHKRPFRSRHTFGTHSPIGCFRTGGDEYEISCLFKVMTGMWPSGIEFWPLFQATISKLKERPDLAKTLPLVLTPTPLFNPRQYESPSPRGFSRRGRVLGGGPGKNAPAKPPPGWDPATGTFKPPWVK